MVDDLIAEPYTDEVLLVLCGSWVGVHGCFVLLFVVAVLLGVTHV